MPDKMTLVITLRKEIPDRDAGRAIFDIVKERLNDRPDIVISGHVSNHFTDEEGSTE